MKNHLTLETDGRVDLLTGLDAPEIFYRFLHKAIAKAEREMGQDHARGVTSRLALVRFRLVGVHGESLFPKIASLDQSQVSEGVDRDNQRLLEVNDLAFSVAHLSKYLSEMVRADENLARLGEVTFLLVAQIGSTDDLTGLLRRFEVSLSQFDLQWRERRLTVEITGFIHQQGENLLDLLERAEV